MIELFAPILLTPTPGQWVQEIRDWQSEQNRVSVEEMLNSSLAELENGCNDPSKQEVLLQFQSYEDQKSLRWRYNRCGDRSWIRSSEDGKSEDCWSRHSREEDTGFGGEGTWVRCDELVEGETN